ncbi:MAG: hypothetical protein NTX87_00320 [Planctomycetota bacterium]|nr:hypothetical protein [Planctomycetota bacterium]
MFRSPPDIQRAAALRRLQDLEVTVIRAEDPEDAARPALESAIGPNLARVAAGIKFAKRADLVLT